MASDLSDLRSLYSEWILVDGDHVTVLEQSSRRPSDVSKVIGHEQRQGHDSPHPQLHFLLTLTQSEVTNCQLKTKNTN